MIDVKMFLLSPLRWEVGVVALWFVRSSPEQAVQFRALGGDPVLCS